MNLFTPELTQRLQRMRTRNTAEQVLQEFIDIDVTADDLVRILKHNPAYKALFERFVNLKTKGKSTNEAPENKEKSGENRDPATPTHRLVSLLGMLGSRNFLLSLRQHKALYGNFPLNSDGSLQDVKAADYLEIALEWEEIFQRNNFKYPETLFAAGVYCDWMEGLAKADGSHKKNFDVWKRFRQQSFRAAAVAYALGERVPGFSYQKFAPAAAVCALMGERLLFLIHGDVYRDFLEESKDLPLSARILLEQEQFQWSSAELSELCLQSFRVFQFLSRPVRFAREPYRLESADVHERELAYFLQLSLKMAESWKLPIDEKDPVLKHWDIPKHLKIRPKTLIETMRSAMNVR